MFKRLKTIGSKIGLLAVTAVTAVTAFGTDAMAALSVDQQAAVTAIETMVTDMESVAWALVLAVTGAFIMIKLFKRFIGKAT